MRRGRGVYLVLRRELLERVRSTTFRVSTLGILVLVAAGIILVDKAPSIFGNGTETLGLVGQTDTPELRQALAQAAGQQDLTLDVTHLADDDQAANALKTGDVNASLSGSQLSYKSRDNTTLNVVVNRALYAVQLPQTLQRLGISSQDASQLLNPQLAQVQLQQPARSDEGDRRAVASIATIGLYLVLVLYGNWILMGVVEEKTSRVVEVLLGLLQPADLLAGKTLGILVAALIQLGFGLAGAVIGLVYVGGSVLPGATPDIAGASIAYLLPGVVLYSLMFAAVGATVSRQSEASSAAMPITFLLLVPYMLSLAVVPNSPDGTLSQVLSIFPLTSPLVMPSRIAMGSPGVIEIAVSYALLWPTLYATAWLGGKIYSMAILMNRSVKPAQILRQILHHEGSGSAAT